MFRPIKTNLLCIISAITFTSCSGQMPQSPVRRFNPTLAQTIGQPVPETAKNIWVIFQDKNNNYWLGSDGDGVYRYDSITIHRFSTRNGLSNDHIREIKEDKAGNIYINTLNGISKFDGNEFTTLTAANTDSSNWKLEPDDLWFKGAHGGPYRYDGKNLYALKFPKHYLEDEYYKQHPNTKIDPYEIYHIYKDHNGNIWFGTGALGIYRYDGRSLGWLYEKELTETKDGSSFGIRSLIEDKEGKFWFCNTKHRYRILPGENEKGKNFINYTREEGIGNITDPMGGDRIYFQTIVEDTTGDLWMQTYADGVWRYDGRKLTHYLVKEGTEIVKIISMYRDTSGVLWLGTQEKGLYKFNGKEFVKFEVL